MSSWISPIVQEYEARKRRMREYQRARRAMPNYNQHGTMSPSEAARKAALARWGRK